MRILVLRYRFIGDTLLTVPFLRNLRRAFPDAEIDMVVAPYSSDVLIGTPYVDEFITYDPPTIHADSKGQHNTLKAKSRFIRSLRKKKYDKAYVLKRSFSSALIAFLSGAKERIGFDTEKRGFLLTRRVPYIHEEHEVRNFLSVLRADGVPVIDEHLEAWLTPDELAFGDEFLARGEISPGDIIVAIHPFTANPPRSWHEDSFVEAANRLQEIHGVKVIIFGGKRELSLAKYFKERINPPPLIAVGTTTLRETMAILSKCSLLLCNDSGIMHMGAALNVPLIALFGPQSPVKFGPWGEKCSIIYKNFFCSPCRQKFFEECDPSPRMKPMCMEEIGVDEVVTLASTLLSPPVH